VQVEEDMHQRLHKLSDIKRVVLEMNDEAERKVVIGSDRETVAGAISSNQIREEAGAHSRGASY